MAYHTSDYERWQQLDFVIGIEIMLSNNHHGEDVCDEFCGVYPKKFKFVGWHPWCNCIAVAKLADEDEFIARAKARINGDEDVPEGGYSGEVTDMPQAFTDWMQNNAGRLETANSVPYFVRDNAQMIAAAQAPKQPQEMLDLIGHMKAYGHLDGVASGMTDNSIYQKWNTLSDAQRLQVLEQGRYTGMLTTEDDLDFCNLYRSTSRQHMVDAFRMSSRTSATGLTLRI